MKTRWHASELDELSFPVQGTPREKLRFALYAAILAPSGHNAQPWRFRLTDSSVEVWADRSRRLPVIDPHDRELIISCGAALFNLRVALESHGHAVRCELLPERSQPDLLARVRLYHKAEASPLARLWPAIPRRHTHRMPFQKRPVDPGHLWAMQEAASLEGCRFYPLVSPMREEAIGLIGEVDERLSQDSLYRQALHRWLEGHETSSEVVAEGVEVVMLDQFASTLPRLLTRLRGLDRGVRDQKLAREAPLMALVASSGDEPLHWIVAGQGLQRVLLEGALHGLQASYLNQPLELPDTRAWLARWTPGSTPHLMLRLGYPEHPLNAPPRRPLAEVLEE